VDTDESSEAVNWQAPDQKREPSECAAAVVAAHHRAPVWLTAVAHSKSHFPDFEKLDEIE